MSYDAYEDSEEWGSPVTTYMVRVGEDTTHLIGFTDSDRPIVRQITLQPENIVREVTFEPLPVDRNEFEDEGQGDRSSLSLVTSISNPLVALFKDYPPAAEVFIHVAEGHDDDASREFREIWTGRILSMKWEESGVEFVCEAASIGIARPARVRNFQRQCPHALYSQGTGLCNAVKQPVTYNIRHRLNNTVAVATPNWVKANADRYEGGTVEFVGDGQIFRDIRTILRVETFDDGLVLTVPGMVTTAASSATLLMGCKRTENSCKVWHDNIVNFGGQIFIPEDNPVGKMSTYF